jgi:phosphate transport system substrate-binding protein
VRLTRILIGSTVACATVVTLAACGGGSSSSSANADCASGSIKAAGSSAQGNAITDWINSYQTQCPDATIDYQAVGSGAGVEQFVAKQTSFAGTDSGVKDADLEKANERCSGGPAINIPMVGGAIAVVYNLADVDGLILTSDIIAKIFTSAITKWNDPAIAALNAGKSLPDATIAQFHRSDSSGTTDNFTKYLAATAPSAWTFAPGKDWIAPGGQGAKGSDQVIASVDGTANSIGYVELSFLFGMLNTKAALIDNGGGPVEATSATAATTIAAATVTGTGNDLLLKIDYTTKASGAYPIVLVTYEVVCEKGLSAGQNPALVKSFLTFAASDAGQSQLTPSGYVPITGTLLAKVRTAVSSLATS